MKVTVYCINMGTSSQYFGLMDAEEGSVLRYAPNNWKTVKGAIRWAAKNGYEIPEVPIAKPVPSAVKYRTIENMEVYHLSLVGAFKEAASIYARKGTELWEAWYHDDFRAFIPSAYINEYLDFKKYPLEYQNV